MARNGRIHILALAAIVGGILRLIEPLMEHALNAARLHTFYVLVDVFLILGFFGIGDAMARLGRIGAALGVIGLLMIRIGPVAGITLYQAGAALTLFGVAFIGIDILQRNTDSRIAAVLFIAALVIGLAALIPQMAMPAAFAAGMAFGLGFLVQGVVLARR
ncbi:MAG TPA: hypothetical protein VID67_03220 [Rhizomicrobium sp.]|jgi:hypothetical protein